MADFERPLANNSRTCNTSSPLYIPSPPLGRVWRRRSSEVGIFHSGDFAEYVSGGFVHFSSGDDTGDQVTEINLACEPYQDNEAGTRKSPAQRAHAPRLRFFRRFLHCEPPRKRGKRTSVLRFRGELGTFLRQCTAVADQGLPPCSSGFRTRTLEQPHHSDVTGRDGYCLVSNGEVGNLSASVRQWLDAIG